MKYLFSTLLIACVSVLMSAQPKLNLNTGSIDFEATGGGWLAYLVY